MNTSQHALSSSDTLQTLPTPLRHGLLAVATSGLLSLTTTLALFACLTYRLVTWHHRGQIRDGPNQFFILVYNLVIADMQQASAFALTSTYLIRDMIEVGGPACAANGWFVSVGDMASGVFIFGISLHTFLSVVKGRNVSDRTFYTCLAGAWCFIYMMATLTVSLHPHVYARAGAWCWIDQRYDKARLWLHYFWIFVCMLGTVITYALVYTSITAKLLSRVEDDTDLATMRRAARYMVVYPGIYVICTLPLAGGRMAAMTGINIPYWYYCLAGAAITSCGWLDVLLYILTRHAFIFSEVPPPRASVGLHTFGWYEGSDFYGTTTTIEGPLSRRRKTLAETEANIAGGIGFNWLLRGKKRYSDEQYFATTMDGVIVTKTTVEITSGPIQGCFQAASSILDFNEDGGSIECRSSDV